MKLYLTRSKYGVKAIAEFDSEAGTFTVLKGSKVSATIAHTEKFRGAKSIENSRESTVVDNVVVKDVVFKSASTAANYVTGSSTNGMIAWKDERGLSLKALLESMEA